MKKTLIILTCLLTVLYLQFGMTPTLNQSTINHTADHYELHLVVTANKLFIIDKEKTAELFIQKTIHNNFKNMHLSYDVHGYPDEISMTVYSNYITKFLDIPAFSFRYAQELPSQYNFASH